VTPERLAEIRKQDIEAGSNLTTIQRDRRALLNEVDRLRNLVVRQQAQIDQFMARIQHALKELESDD